MKSKEIPKVEGKRRVNTATDPSKKVYLTPSEFLWDNHKREELKTRGERKMTWKDKGIEPEQAKQLEDLFMGVDKWADEEAKITKKQLKTILKNFNNVAKGIRNINRALKESL